MPRKARRRSLTPLSAHAQELVRERIGLAAIEEKGLTHRQASAIFEAFKREALQSGEWVPGCAWKVGI